MEGKENSLQHFHQSAAHKAKIGCIDKRVAVAEQASLWVEPFEREWGKGEKNIK